MPALPTTLSGSPGDAVYLDASGSLPGLYAGNLTGITGIASGAVVSGNIASGQVGQFHLASGVVNSGHISSGAVLGAAGGGARTIASGTIAHPDLGSGAVQSGDVASGQIGFGHLADASVKSGSIASGQVGWPHIASGAVRSGDIGDAAVLSGSIASGQVASGHMASGFIFYLTNAATLMSGQVTSGFLGDASVVSGSLASGQISRFALASGAVNSGHVASGAVIGSLGGGALTIASGTIGPNDLGSGSVLSGAIASGQVGQNALASGAVTSGAIASGQVGFNHLSSGSVGSGALASGQVSQFKLASGAVNSGHVGSGAVVGAVGGGARTIASGTVAHPDFGSGAIQSGDIASGQVGFGHLANASVQSGTVASGQLATYHLASGAVVTEAVFGAAFISGTAWTAITEEIISGVRAVALSQSGNLRVAMASVSGRMPAIGIVVENVASGIQANVHTQGVFQFTSGLADYSGFIGVPVLVGRSGHLVTISGSFNSGGLLSGDVLQPLGVALNSGGTLVRVGTNAVSGVPGYGSGVIGSGSLGDASVLSGSIASGTVSQFKLASGAVNSGHVGSGAIVGAIGAGRSIASGTIAHNDFGSGAILSGDIASGQVGFGHLANASVQSGTLASGVVSRFHLASGAVNSGQVASGAVAGSLGGGAFNIASGTVGPNELGSGAILSGAIASGQVGFGHLASGSVGSGALASGQVTNLKLGSGAVTSGTIASGQVGFGHLANASVQSGTLASGQVSQFALASGAVNSGQIGSGAVVGAAGAGRSIASGTVAHNDFGSGAILSGDIASGQIGFGHLANASVQSGTIASGQVSQFALASGVITTIPTGRTLWVDGVNGNDTAAQRGFQNLPFLGVSGALNAAASGDVVALRPGSYAETVVAKAGVALRGADALRCVIAGTGASGEVVVLISGVAAVSISDLTITTAPASGAITMAVGFGGSISGTQIARCFINGDTTNVGSRVTAVEDFTGGGGPPANTPPLLKDCSVTLIKATSGSIGVSKPGSSQATYEDLRINLDTNANINSVGLQVTAATAGLWLIRNRIESPLLAAALSLGNNPTVYIDNESSFTSFSTPGANALIRDTNFQGSTQQQITYPRDNFIATTDPTATDDQSKAYGYLSRWLNTTTGEVWILVNPAQASAVWIRSTLAANAVLSGAIASGVISRFKMASGAINSGHVGSGAVLGSLGGGAFTIASGTVGPNDLGSGSVLSGAIASGQIGQFHLASGSVTSGRLGVTGTPDGTQFLKDDFTWSAPTASVGSGGINSGKIASGAVQGFFGSTRHIASGTVGVFDLGSGAVVAGAVGSGAVVSGNIASGQVGVNHLASGSVTSGAIASGQVGHFHLASGAVASGQVGDSAVVSGSIASGQVATPHIASGAVINAARHIIDDFSAAGSPLITNQTLSNNFYAVSISQSGLLQPAQASVSGTMPAIGLAVSGALSGQPASFWTEGFFQMTAGQASVFAGAGWSGFIGQPLYVGRDGQLGPLSGGTTSGGFLSGDIIQRAGIIINSGGVRLSFDPFTKDAVQSPPGTFWISSGAIASGQIGQFHLASGSVVSGHVGSGAIQGMTGGGVDNIASGTIGPFDLGSGAVLSGAIASGQIGSMHLSSGAVIDAASHVIDDFSAGGSPLTTEETISGVRAVAVSQSGNLRIAMPGVSGRMPAVGIAISGALSGQPASFWSLGFFQLSSGMIDFSGVIGQPLFISRSGHIAPMSGGFLSGGFQSGDIAQGAGTIVNSGAARFAIERGTRGGPLDAPATFWISSGDITSGQIGQFHIASGAVNSGHIASGNIITYARNVYEDTMIAGEAISGVVAVALNSGGCCIVRAQAGSGLRMPAIGISVTNVVSGALCTFVTHGKLLVATSGVIGGSGFYGGLNALAYVGSGGFLLNKSGFVTGASSGGGPGVAGTSGRVVQRVGVFISGGIFISLDLTVTSGLIAMPGGAPLF